MCDECGRLQMWDECRPAAARLVLSSSDCTRFTDTCPPLLLLLLLLLLVLRSRTGFAVRVFSQYALDASPEGPSPRKIWGSLGKRTVVVRVRAEGSLIGKAWQCLGFSGAAVCVQNGVCMCAGGVVSHTLLLCCQLAAQLLTAAELYAPSSPNTLSVPIHHMHTHTRAG
jgi:hypothetical protein